MPSIGSRYPALSQDALTEALERIARADTHPRFVHTPTMEPPTSAPNYSTLTLDHYTEEELQTAFAGVMRSLPEPECECSAEQLGLAIAQAYRSVADYMAEWPGYRFTHTPREEPWVPVSRFRRVIDIP